VLTVMLNYKARLAAASAPASLPAGLGYPAIHPASANSSHLNQ
jgi:hypothetical protein